MNDFKLFVNVSSKFYQQNKSSESKVRFRQASNYCEKVLEAAKLAYANKTKESSLPRNLVLGTFILFPETRAIACAHAGTHVSKFMCAIYRMCEIIVFSHKEKFFIEGFSIEHN